MIPVGYQFPAAALLVIGGLISCFAGYRFFRAILVLYGVILGALVATSLVGAGNTAQLALAAVGGAFAGGLIFYFAYFVGVALVGAAVGTFFVHAIWAEIGRDPHPVVIILFAIAGAAAAMVLQRYVIIVATAFVGSWTLIVGLLALIGSGGSASAADVWIVYPFSPQPPSSLWVVAWFTLGTIGALVQLGITGRGKPRPAKKSKEKAEAA